MIRIDSPGREGFGRGSLLCETQTVNGDDRRRGSPHAAAARRRADAAGRQRWSASRILAPMQPGDMLELPFGQSTPSGETRKVLTVASLNREARVTLESQFGVVWVEGEISNLTRPSSG